MKTKSLVIEILNVDWVVKIINSLGPAEPDGELLGTSNYNTKEILVSGKLNNKRFREIIIHEITHAVIQQALLCKQEFCNEEVCEFLERYCDYIYEKTNEVFNLVMKNE